MSSLPSPDSLRKIVGDKTNTTLDTPKNEPLSGERKEAFDILVSERVKEIGGWMFEAANEGNRAIEVPLRPNKPVTKAALRVISKTYTVVSGRRVGHSMTSYVIRW